MDRMQFLKTMGLLGLGAGTNGFGVQAAAARHPCYGTPIGSRPYNDPLPDGDPVMTTTPTDQVVPNYGMGLITYVVDEFGPENAKGEPLASFIERLAAFPLGQKLYLRVNWKDLQQEPDKLNPYPAWHMAFEMAAKYNKRISFRVMVGCIPDPPTLCLPDFVANKVRLVRLGKTDKYGYPDTPVFIPLYSDPEFQRAFRKFDDMLAKRYNGHPLVEYMDTYMYGFWGEGHTWPFKGNPFPSPAATKATFMEMFDHQLSNWDRVPLTTNLSPDINNVGNDAILDKSIRTNNWVRVDSLFVTSHLVTFMTNRHPWTGFALEVGGGWRASDPNRANGRTLLENEIYHAMDVNPTYYSLWNQRRISADNLQRAYEANQTVFDRIARSIGYRIRPSWIWHVEKEDYPPSRVHGLVIGLLNDGVAGVPGALRLSLKKPDGQEVCAESLEPGYPAPRSLTTVPMVLPPSMDWKGLRLSCEIQVKGVRHLVKWACYEDTNPDGSLTLKSVARILDQ